MSIKAIDDDRTLMRIDNSNSSHNQMSILEIESPPDDNTPYLTFFFNIKYKRIGNTFAFNFDSFGNPKYVIGPSWMFFIVLMSFTIIMGGFIYVFLLQPHLPWFFHIFYLVCFLNLIYVYIVNVLINPGIVLRPPSYSKIMRYCLSCKVHLPVDMKVDHCAICNVCVEELDHHCVWMTKCVGKNNKKWFYGYITSFALFYLVIIASVIYVNIYNKPL